MRPRLPALPLPQAWLAVLCLLALPVLPVAGPVHAETLVAAEAAEEEESDDPSEEVDPSTLPPDVAALVREQLRRAAAAAGGAEGDAGAAAGTNAPARDRSEQRLQEFLKLTFDRSPTNVLREVSLRLGSATTNRPPAEQFRSDVVSGDWPAVKQALAAMSANHADRVFRHVVEQLARPLRGMVSLPEADPAPPGFPGAPAAPRVPPPVVLEPDDVLGLAAAHPGPIGEETAQSLGSLLRGSLRNPALLEPVTARLRAGVGSLGGPAPEGRAAAAALLIGAEALAEAGPFLPPLDEAPGSPQPPGTLDLHARYLVALAGSPRTTNALTLRRRAWDLSQALLVDPHATPAQRESALRRLVHLAPRVPGAERAQWVRQVAGGDGRAGVDLLIAVAQLAASGVTDREVDRRRDRLQLCREAVEALLPPGADEPAPTWNAALHALTAVWLHEAERSQLRYRKARPRGVQYAPYGNPMWMGGEYDPEEMQNRDPASPPPLSFEAALATAPSAAWLQRLSPHVRARVHLMTASLHIKDEEEVAALPHLKAVAQHQPRAAWLAARDLLKGWARSHDPGGSGNEAASNPYAQRRFLYPGAPAQMGIPLTRAAQARNLKELAGILRELAAWLPEPPDDTAVVTAFLSAHSPAEVYQQADIEQVLGPSTSLRPGLIATLCQAMRQRLAGQWRAPRIQQQLQTHRTDKETAAEVGRGYAILDHILEEAVGARGEDWRLRLAQGAALFDWAEFDYGNKVELAVYTARRDKAFAAFERAAALYAAGVSSMPSAEQSPQVYDQWLNATLGASDLAFLTRMADPGTRPLDRIKAAIQTLPPAAQDRHRDMMGRGLADRLQALKPEFKPRYLRAVLRVLGDHPAAAEASRLVSYYDDLLGELELSVQVDGSARVGHDRPFAVLVSIRHSEAIARESGGFGRYLQNQQNPGGYAAYGQAQANYRDDFEKQVRERLVDGFEVLSVTFHDPKVESRGFGRTGWRETPYACLLLRARDAAVDRIPPLQLDLEFLDRHGQVVLPVSSPPQLIDARPGTGDPRPLESVEITEVLDAREAGRGRITLEYKASGRGLLPPVADLLDLAVPGFELDAPASRTAGAVTRVDAAGDKVAPISELGGALVYRPAPGANPAPPFRFPRPRSTGAAIATRRLADGDLADAPAEVALALPGATRGLLLHPGVIAVAGLIMATAIAMGWRMRARRGRALPGRVRHPMPEELTPFSVIALLRGVAEDPALRLTDAQRLELTHTLGALHRRFFAPPAASPPAEGESPDLHAIATRWVKAVDEPPDAAANRTGQVSDF